MRKNLLLIFILTFTTCFGQLELRNLENAYKNNSLNQYNQFLQNWHSESIPITSQDSLSNLEKDVYEIFEDFYNPFKLKRIGTGERGNKLYSNIDYVVIQNSIFIYTYKTDSLNFHVLHRTDSLIVAEDSIVNFRPGIEFRGAKTLYLFPKYEEVINKFLGSKDYPLGASNIMDPAKVRGESEKRLAFMNKKLKILYGHWGGYWHIETHPEVYNIKFNNNRTIAKVNYRLVYQGGEALYFKEKGKWRLQKAHLTWIE